MTGNSLTPTYTDVRDGPASMLQRFVNSSKGPPLRGARLLAVSLILAAAIPLLLFSSWVAYLTAYRGRTEARAAAAQTTEHVAERVNSELAKEIQVAEALATSAALDEPDLSSFYTEARRLTDARPLWDTVSLTLPDGTHVLNILRPLGKPIGRVTDQKGFDAVVRSGRPAIGGIGPIDELSGKRLVPLRVPVLRDGKIRFVLTVGLIPSEISAILLNAGAPDGWIGVVVDQHGNVVARTSADQFEIGNPADPAIRDAIDQESEGFYRGITLGGLALDSVLRKLPVAPGWSVHFGIPSEQLDSPVTRSLLALSGGGLASLALGTGLSFLIARDIAQRRREEASRSALMLRNSQERGDVAIEAAELGTWRWDLDKDQIAGSERFRALLDLPRMREDGAEWHWPSDVVLGAVHPQDSENFRAAIRACGERSPQLDVEFRALRSDGKAHWVRAIGRRSRTLAERNGAIRGVLADVEPSKRAEADRRQLLRRLAEAQEAEQRRIARELHDQVGQTVTGLALGLKGLEQSLRLGTPTQAASAQIRWLQDLAAGIGRDIHQAALDLRPTALDDLGLQRALLAYTSEWSRRRGILVDAQLLGSEDRLPTDVDTALYRIVQEALTNVQKHAAAKNVSIVLERTADQVRLVVEDDGNGFDPDVLDHGDNHGKCLGLVGMRERLSLIEGTIALESAPGVGTTLFVQVPLVRKGTG